MQHLITVSARAWVLCPKQGKCDHNSHFCHCNHSSAASCCIPQTKHRYKPSSLFDEISVSPSFLFVLRVQPQTFRNGNIEIFSVKPDVVVCNKSRISCNTRYNLLQCQNCGTELYGHNGWEDRHNGVNKDLYSSASQISILLYEI
jgi:hypothetical protein